jgi:xanthine dehydrogenase YagR molybdenum-binding subunit
VIPKIGDPRDRVDGRAKVTGAAKYAYENSEKAVAYGALVSATIPAGTIQSIDATAAKKATGVIAVLSHVNAPKLNPLSSQGGGSSERQSPTGGSSGGGGGQQGGGQQGGGGGQQTNYPEPRLIPFADNRIEYLGQHIAIVVADTLEHAMHGAELVKVTYSESPARIDLANFRGEARDKTPNSPDSKFTKGDADGAFASAPVKIDQTYRTPYEHHNPMEAHSVLVAWDGDHVTVHDSSQNIFAVRGTFARAFGIPRENVHVMSPFVGGAFGSKGSSWPHVLITAIAAHEVKRPVKVMVTRRQLFFANGHRPLTEQRVAIGATPDGKLVSLIHDGIGQSNTVCDYVERTSRPSRVMYDVPNMNVRHRVVELNVSTPTYMRAPGENPGMFAIESALDELAYALKIDPVQLRIINHADNDPSSGKPWSSKSLKECYAQAAERFGWSRRNATPRSMRDGHNLIGMGMASATYPAHRSPASARATVKSDGSVLVTSGSHEMGMGTATVMAQLAAETLGVPFERVQFQYGDTTLPQAPISAGSMTAASVGTAVFEVAQQLREKVAALESVDPSTLTADSYHSILAKHYLDKVEAQVDSKPPQQESHAAQAFGAHFAEVAVDEDLGLVRLRRMVSAFASGRVLNAKTARSQYLGGIIQGIGMALTEETHLDRHLGSYVNVNLGEYLLPVHADIHDLDIIMVEEDDEHVNPIGAKGIGEIGIVGVAPAIANAVYHATGKRIRDLPITIEKLL